MSRKATLLFMAGACLLTFGTVSHASAKANGQVTTKPVAVQNGIKRPKAKVSLKIKLPNPVHLTNRNGSRSSSQVNPKLVDHDRQDISGMRSFTAKRAPYRYTAIGGNTRDLGGYLTQDRHYRTRSDRIIRSADLIGISQRGIRDLQKLHVNQIIDLRYFSGKNGIQGHPDPNELQSGTLRGTHIKFQKAPIYTHTEARKLNSSLGQRNRKEYYYYGPISVSSHRAIRSYRRVFRDLLGDPRGAVLLHCNLGRDRTGTTSALILSALGVSRDTIYHDYLLTDYYHYKYKHTLPYPQQAGELQHFFNTIDRHYGSVQNYLADAIGLNHADVQRLRRMDLIPVR